MRDFLAIAGFLFLQFCVLALIGVWQEHKRRKNRIERAIGEQYGPAEGPSPRLERFLRQ